MTLLESETYFKDNYDLRAEISLKIRNDTTVSEELRTYLATFYALPDSYIIIRDEEIIGVVFGEILKNDQFDLNYEEVLYTSYYIFPEFRGNNYIVQAIKLYEQLVKISGIKYLEFCVSKYNKSSLRVMEKIDAKKEWVNFFKKIE